MKWQSDDRVLARKGDLVDWHHLTRTISGLTPTSPWVGQGMTIVPLVGADTGTVSYLTLEEAEAAGGIALRELPEGAEVSKILCTNHLSSRVFLLDGEELAGARQNRVVNLSVMLEPQSQVILPVSCVEQGRWRVNGHGESFSSSGNLLHVSARARKMEDVGQDMVMTGRSDGDQGRLWDQVRQLIVDRSADSATYAMSEVYEQASVETDEIVTQIPLVDGQRGCILAASGEFQSMCLFDKASTFQKLSRKIFRSMVIDHAGRSDAACDSSVEDFLKEIVDCSLSCMPSPICGYDARLFGGRLCGAGLFVGEGFVHLEFNRLISEV